MVTEEEKKQESYGKGFAGLSLMVSDVEVTVTIAPQQQQIERPSSSKQQSPPADSPEREEQSKPNQQTYQWPPQPSGGSYTGWIVIAALIGVIWLGNQLDDNISSRSTYTPAPSSVSVAPTPVAQPPAFKSQESSRPAEEQPSIGRNKVLSTAQIRYCLAEKIRLDAAESVINKYDGTDVDRFNAYVNDYNSRCSEFSYRQGALESAQRSVEPYSSQLHAEGRSRFVRSPSAATRSQTPALTPQVARPSPDATIQAIQKRLNELGYDAGPADGLFGSRTRAAIQAFQRESGMASDGAPSNSLSKQLNLATSLKPSNTRQGHESANNSVADSPKRVVQIEEPSRDVENFQKCIDGRYPSLCDHALLTPAEATRVDAAERKANFDSCIDGRYPSLCNHALLTPAEATRVDAAERNANFDSCIDGRYPSLCNHALLTTVEATRVDAAERKANFDSCIDGRYPSLCNHSLLTTAEATRVDAAERKANFDICIDGRYPSSCKHSLLTQDEAARVTDAERRALGQ